MATELEKQNSLANSNNDFRSRVRAALYRRVNEYIATWQSKGATATEAEKARGMWAQSVANGGINSALCNVCEMVAATSTIYNTIQVKPSGDMSDLMLGASDADILAAVTTAFDRLAITPATGTTSSGSTGTGTGLGVTVTL